MKEKTKKPRYRLGQNMLWMLRQAHAAHRDDVPVFAVIKALAMAGTGISGLLLAPEIVRCVEEGAGFSRILATIAVLAGVLLVCSAVSAYLEHAPMFARVDVRLALIRKIHYKTCVMSYPLSEDPEVLKLQEQAVRATINNRCASEALWVDEQKLLTAALSFVVYLLLLTNTSVWLLAALTVTTAAEYFVNRRINEWGYRHRDESAELEKKMDYVSDKARSTVLGKDIRIFGMRPWLEAVYDKTLRAIDAFVERRERVYFWTNVIDAVLTAVRNGLAYYFLLRQTLAGGMGAGDFLLCFSAVGAYTEQLNGILTELGTLRRQSLELCTLREFLELPEPFRMEGGKSLPECADGKYELRLENVSFRYPGAEADTLHGIDLTVHPGERLAVVGLNGAGKTTLVKLLCGFYDPTEGRVLLNGEDIREFNRQEYYTLFTAVFQKFSVLEATLEENVAQTREGIDEAYYDLLVSNLKALGFTGANVDYTTLLNTVNDSIENYYHVQERLYKLFREKGFEDELALAGSKDRAAGLQFEYLYRHSPSIAFFELAVYAADLNLDDLPVFYSNAERQNRDPNEYDIVLGAALGK